MTKTAVRQKPPAALSRKAIRHLPVAMVIADAQMDDWPIIYVNRAFTRMTGYTEEMAVGRNCRFLQGEETDPNTRRRLRDALSRGEEITVDILNYRADGSSFMNHLMIAPLHDDKGTLTHFVGVQTLKTALTGDDREVAALRATLRDMQAKVRNHLAMIFNLIRLQARQGQPGDVVGLLANRVTAISLLYDDAPAVHADRGNGVDLGAYVSRLAAVLYEQEGRPPMRLNIAVEPVAVEQDDAVRIGLILSEVLTNAFQVAERALSYSQVSVRLKKDGGRVKVVVSDDAQGVAAQSWPDLDTIGGRIVTGLVLQLNAELGVTRGSDGQGTEVSVEFAVPSTDTLKDMQSLMH